MNKRMSRMYIISAKKSTLFRCNLMIAFLITFLPFLVFQHLRPRRCQTHRDHNIHHIRFMQHISFIALLPFQSSSVFHKHRFKMQRRLRHILRRRLRSTDGFRHIHHSTRINTASLLIHDQMLVLLLSFPQLLAEIQPLVKLLVDIRQALVLIDQRVSIIAVLVQSQQQIVRLLNVERHRLIPRVLFLAASTSFALFRFLLLSICRRFFLVVAVWLFPFAFATTSCCAGVGGGRRSLLSLFGCTALGRHQQRLFFCA
mmetsp:Transcript_18787/g.29822  ORF Transcript_18787/g.29822 Transcript_18787/m.29822 type:complete len:257 (+) Transcript_18787:112-882(+)